MVKSKSRKFVFVHIQKTGGCSIKSALNKNIPDAQEFLGTHDPAISGLSQMGDSWEKLFTFSVVRNPWARLVSWYSMISQADPATVKQNHRFWQYIWQEGPTFEDFLVRCTDVIDDFDGRKCAVFNQLDYLTDPGGRTIVNFIGKLENIKEDAPYIFKKIGLEGCKLHHYNKSKHGHYSEYYTPALRDLVGERFRRDIEHFDYQFEDRSAEC